jgi:hypothetical protein
MINPSTLIGILVDDLRSVPGIVRHLKDDPERIFEYTDVAPRQSSLQRAIYEMRSPGVMIAYEGTSSSNEGILSHSVSLYIRARDSAGANVGTYAALIAEIYNARPLRLDGQKLFCSEWRPEIRQLAVPDAQRIHDEEGNLDIFQMVTRFEEDFDNDGLNG